MNTKERARKAVADASQRIRAGERFTEQEYIAYQRAIVESKDTSPAQIAREKQLSSGWELEFIREILLPDWQTTSSGIDGATYDSTDGLRVLTSAAVELDGRRWLHVSCSRQDRLPSWNDLKRVKDLFIGQNQQALQVLPKQTKYVNIHPRVLHLFTCLDEDPVPDFTRGTESL